MTYGESGIVFDNLQVQFRHISVNNTNRFSGMCQNYHKKLNKHPILFQTPLRDVSL